MSDKVINRMVVVEAWNHQGPYLESVVNEGIDPTGTVPENEGCNMVKLFQFQYESYYMSLRAVWPVLLT